MTVGMIIGLVALAAFLAMIFLGIPVTFSMMACGTVGAMFVLRTPLSAITLLQDSVFASFTSYTLCVAPMFILMGELATESKIGGDLFDCFQKLFGHRKGGLASASQVVCAIFGAICGSTAATGAMMSRIAYPQMKRFQYDDMLSAGSIASGSCLASLIPPSMHLITYGIAAEESIGKLLMGGITTGIVLMILFIITVRIWCRVNPSVAPASEANASVREKLVAIRKGGFIEIVLVFALAMGGMFAGWFTPTESGAVGFAGMLIVAILFRRFSVGVLKKALRNTMVMTGMIYCLMAGANCFGRFFTLTKIPNQLGALVQYLGIPAIGVIAVLTVMYLVLGCFIDGVALILLTTPIFLPVVEASGFSSLWFGCYMVVIVGLGAVTPPVGMNCYIVSGVSGVPLDRVFRGSMPFVFAYVAMALLLALVPGIATALPNLVM
ncbi:MAG: TRAP transporter large permease [Clostridiales Family XIII bacterium]|jgi:tripartite ATP-independent transporter DctM subunit|nr:TRAP transporter large permease [Clostridiales Family XIII bacterium]